jgi:hypothetical protein
MAHRVWEVAQVSGPWGTREHPPQVQTGPRAVSSHHTDTYNCSAISCALPLWAAFCLPETRSGPNPH